MYNLLIVDDELRTRTGLSTLVKWNALGFQVVGLCNDGLKAIEFLKTIIVDVILTDIRMDGMNGIELAKKVYQDFPNIQTVFMSGYRDFEYVREALQYGVQNYLLKPIKLDEVNQTFLKIKDGLDKLRETASHVSKESLFYIKNEFFRFLTYGIIENRNHIEMTGKQLNMDFLEEQYQLVVFDLENDVATSFGPMVLLDYIKQICFSIFPYTTEDMIFHQRSNRFIALIRPIENSSDIHRLKNIILHSQEDSCIPIRVGISLTHNGYLQVASAYREAVNAIQSMSPQFCVSVYNPNNNNRTSPNISDEDVEITVECLCKGNEDAVYRIVSNVTHRLQYNSTLSETKNNIIHFLSDILAKLPKIDDSDISYTDLCEAKDEAKLADMLLDIFRTLIHRISTLSQNTEKVSEFENVIQYIHAHYTDCDLRLEQLASMLYVSVSYFSRLFKEKCGRNFSEYLTSLRLDHAMELIDKGFPIGEASKMSGYSNTKYFSRLFKQQNGITASEYRIGKKELL